LPFGGHHADNRARCSAQSPPRPKPGDVYVGKKRCAGIPTGTFIVSARLRLSFKRGIFVKKIEEYLQHAAECRQMALSSPPQHREQLEEMAKTWEQLAEARRRDLSKKEI